MIKDHFFKYSLLISLIIHSAIFLYGIDFSNLQGTQRKNKDFQITYLVYKKEEASLSRNLLPPKPLPKDLVLKKTPDLDKKEKLDSHLSKEIIKPSFPQKSNLFKTDIIAVKKKVTLPELNLDKINNPSYANYYQIIREKIKHCAYQNYNRTDIGQVYLSFVVSSDGYLKEIRLIEEKSTQNQYLKNVALKSIRDASPFPPFPAELKFSSLSFNVIISFETE